MNPGDDTTGPLEATSRLWRIRTSEGSRWTEYRDDGGRPVLRFVPMPHGLCVVMPGALSGADAPKSCVINWEHVGDVEDALRMMRLLHELEIEGP